MASARANRRGILAMLAGMAFFIGSDACVKLVAVSTPPAQIMGVRGVFATLIALALVLLAGDRGRLRQAGGRQVLLRAGIEALVAFLFFVCIGPLPLAELTAILQASPVILVLATAVLGLERVGWRRLAAVAAGFLGVLLIVRPDPQALNLYALLALVCAALVALRDLVTRGIPADTPTTVAALTTNAVVCAAGFAITAGFEAWAPLSVAAIGLLAAAALSVTLGSLCVISAFRHAEIGAVSPFRYSIVPMSLVMGFLVFGEWPDATALLGTLVVVASGLYTLHRERVRRAEAVRPAS